MNEVEKISLVIKTAINFLLNNKNVYISHENEALDMIEDIMFDNSGLDLKLLCVINNSDVIKVLKDFGWKHPENYEHLTDLMLEIYHYGCTTYKKALLEKALFLLEYCRQQDKTFKSERENKIEEIKKLITNNSES